MTRSRAGGATWASPRSSIPGGTQAVDEAAHLVDGLADAVHRRDLEQPGHGVVHQRLRGLDLQPQTGQRRAQAVVQVTTQALPFGLARGDELLTTALQLAVQLQRRHGGRHLGRDGPDDRGVARVQLGLAGPAPHEQGPHVLPRWRSGTSVGGSVVGSPTCAVCSAAAGSLSESTTVRQTRVGTVSRSGGAAARSEPSWVRMANGSARSP